MERLNVCYALDIKGLSIYEIIKLRTVTVTPENEEPIHVSLWLTKDGNVIQCTEPQSEMFLGIIDVNLEILLKETLIDSFNFEEYKRGVLDHNKDIYSSLAVFKHESKDQLEETIKVLSVLKGRVTSKHPMYK
jgi:hypothetical protein